MAVERTALFVRVPTDLSEQLTARIQQAGRSKQDVVCDLLEAQMSAGDLPAGNGDGGSTGCAEDGTSDVLDLAGIATLLAVEPESVLERIAAGDFPGRRFDDEWRFSRDAVMHWLAGTDPVEATTRPGFAVR